MSDELRSTTFKVLKPVMGYVEGEEPTILDLDSDREEEYLSDGSLEYVSGDKPDSLIEEEKEQADEAAKVEEVAAKEADGTLDYNDLTVEELKTLLESRGLETPEGTGNNGNVVKDDYVTALEADDQKGDE